MKKLPKDFKEKWIKALRSGEYKQGKDMLRKGDAFCCLGVACDVYKPKTWNELGGCYETKSSSIYTPSGGDLPDKVMMSLNSSYNVDAFVMKHLMDMNDNGKSFTEIADWIEEHL